MIMDHDLIPQSPTTALSPVLLPPNHTSPTPSLWVLVENLGSPHLQANCRQVLRKWKHLVQRVPFTHSHKAPPRQGEDSPQCCSSEPSEQSCRPSQCLLDGMQVPFGQRNPLHFFSGMWFKKKQNKETGKHSHHCLAGGLGRWRVFVPPYGELSLS